MISKTCAIIILFSSLCAAFVFVPNVQACSGGGTDTIEELLSRTRYVVKADVISVDDVRQNGMLHVDSYLYGGAGPEYLLFVQNDPVVVRRLTEGSPYNYCDRFKSELQTGLSAYFFITRRADGVYTSTTSLHDPDYYTFVENSDEARFYSQDGERFTEHLLDEGEFVDFITLFGQSERTSPDESLSYPRLAPLKITTADGPDYMLPVDTAIPVEVTPELIAEMTQATLGYDSPDWNELYFSAADCLGRACVPVSPNGIQRAMRDGNQIEWLGESRVGEVFLFASTSDAIAIWNEGQLEFYTLGATRADQPFSEVTLLNTVALAVTDDPQSYQAAWSPDGRQFAYSDADGLWWLDVYDPAAEPRLLLPSQTDIIPVALSFSPLGRYLQVEEGYGRFTLDIVTRDQFPTGLVSPDDRLLLAFDTRAQVFNPQICYLAPVRDCEPLTVRTTRVDEGVYRVFTRYTQVAWRNPYSFIVSVCGRDNADDCIVNRIYSIGGNNHFWYTDGYFWTDGYTFTYSELGDTLAVVQDAFTLSIDGAIYDLSAELESPITSIEWLPNLFYTNSPP